MPGNIAEHHSPKKFSVPPKHPFESHSGIQNIAPFENPVINFRNTKVPRGEI
jgi:hypothetical protein